MDWLMHNWLDLTRFWAALIGTGCFGLVGVLVADRFSSYGRIEDVVDGAFATESAQ